MLDPQSIPRRFLFLAVALCAAVQAGAAEVAPIVLSGPTMGVRYRIKCWGNDQVPPKDLQASVDRLLATFDKQMSTYREDSEISRFNRAPADVWFSVSAETAFVAAKAIELHQLTAGACDVTMGPVSRLWRFGPGSRGLKPAPAPSADELGAAQRFVGVERLSVRADPPALKKSHKRLEVDFNSLAPGYAVDLIIALLQEYGFANAIVDVGGEVRGAGAHPDGSPWKVGIERAGGGAPSFIGVAPLVDRALATSGDYRNYRNAEGRRVTHIIDPRTLEPLPYRGVSVTVIATTCIEADALATALLVMGPDAALAWCRDHDVAALFQYRAEGDGQSRGHVIASFSTTPRFDELAPGALTAGR